MPGRPARRFGIEDGISGLVRAWLILQLPALPTVPHLRADGDQPPRLRMPAGRYVGNRNIDVPIANPVQLGPPVGICPFASQIVAPHDIEPRVMIGNAEVLLKCHEHGGAATASHARYRGNSRMEPEKLGIVMPQDDIQPDVEIHFTKSCRFRVIIADGDLAEKERARDEDPKLFQHSYPQRCFGNDSRAPPKLAGNAGRSSNNSTCTEPCTNWNRRSGQAIL